MHLDGLDDKISRYTEDKQQVTGPDHDIPFMGMPLAAKRLQHV